MERNGKKWKEMERNGNRGGDKRTYNHRFVSFNFFSIRECWTWRAFGSCELSIQKYTYICALKAGLITCQYKDRKRASKKEGNIPTSTRLKHFQKIDIINGTINITYSNQSTHLLP
jgi:hypothetical protein